MTWGWWYAFNWEEAMSIVIIIDELKRWFLDFFNDFLLSFVEVKIEWEKSNREIRGSNP